MRRDGIFCNSWGAGPGAAAHRSPRRRRRPGAPQASSRPPCPVPPAGGSAVEGEEGRKMRECARARCRARRRRSPPEEGAAPALIGGGGAARGASRSAPAAAARPRSGAGGWRWRRPELGEQVRGGRPCLSAGRGERGWAREAEKTPRRHDPGAGRGWLRSRVSAPCPAAGRSPQRWSGAAAVPGPGFPCGAPG